MPACARGRSPGPPAATGLPAATWGALADAHARRADALTADHRRRRARGQPHPVEDFLYTYYRTRPSVLRRWHPGANVALLPGPDGPAPHSAWRWYATDAHGVVRLDGDRYAREQEAVLRAVRRLLEATAGRPAFTGCFGLHEWAMVYRQPEHRHPLPLRLGQARTDRVVEASTVRCTHFDAFRFFSPDAVGLNRLQPTRESRTDLEQPGCLHAAMDCHKWALRLGPAVPGDLALDCFALARQVRVLDMQASPYDLSSLGLAPVPVESAEGRAEYVARQRRFAARAAVLRQRLLEVCAGLLPDHRISGGT